MGVITIGEKTCIEAPFDIFNFFKEKYAIKTFFETGTYMGSTSIRSASMFNKVITVELNNELFKKALEKFENLQLKNIIIYNNNSENIIKDYCNNAKESTVFWLDAHYSAGVTSGKDVPSPLLTELKSIMNSELEHFIIVDDVRFICINMSDSIHRYPSIIEITDAVKECGSKYEISIFNDCLFLIPKSKYNDFKEYIITQKYFSETV